jgi:hypothetical protein
LALQCDFKGSAKGGEPMRFGVDVKGVTLDLKGVGAVVARVLPPAALVGVAAVGWVYPLVPALVLSLGAIVALGWFEWWWRCAKGAAKKQGSYVVRRRALHRFVAVSTRACEATGVAATLNMLARVLFERSLVGYRQALATSCVSALVAFACLIYFRATAYGSWGLAPVGQGDATLGQLQRFFEWLCGYQATGPTAGQVFAVAPTVLLSYLLVVVIVAWGAPIEQNTGHSQSDSRSKAVANSVFAPPANDPPALGADAGGPEKEPSTGAGPNAGHEDSVAFECNEGLAGLLHRDYAVAAPKILLEMSNWGRDYQCGARRQETLAVNVMGHSHTLNVGPEGGPARGFILFSDSGDAAMVPFQQVGLVQEIQAAGAEITSLTDVSVDGAILRILYRRDGTCSLAIRPDSKSEWALVEHIAAPRLLAWFVAAGQVARPDDNDRWQMSYPARAVMLAGGVLQGDEAVLGAANNAGQCTSATTLTTLHDARKLEGPPAK